MHDRPRDERIDYRKRYAININANGHVSLRNNLREELEMRGGGGVRDEIDDRSVR